MHLNYYFLSRLAAELSVLLKGSYLAEAFTQQKDELVFGFAKKEKDIYIKCLTGPGIQAITVQEDFNRARRNSADLFKSALDKQVTDVFTTTQDRSFGIRLESDLVLFFKMHGSRSNIILYTNGTGTEQYHKHYEDISLPFTSFEKPDSFSVEKLIANGFQLPPLLPSLGSEPLHWLHKQGFESGTEEEKVELVCTMLETLHHPEKFYILNDNGKALLSFFETHPVLETLDSAVHASAAFLKYYYTFTERNKFLAAEAKNLAAKKSKLQKYIASSEQRLAELKLNNTAEQTGDILMANLHQVPARAESVTLYDFYQNKEREIKLKKELSPQKNAENYYRKGKNLILDVQNLEKVIAQKKAELASLETSIINLDTGHHPQKKKQVREEQESLPYKRFEFEGYEIRVGKSSQKNDELIQQHSHKNDLWMHARGYAGSHVIVKVKQGIPVPQTVIEKAASLAAYYSKGKTNHLCPVIVTERKYVRKSKGMAPGQVTVEKEKTLMVTPSGF